MDELRRSRVMSGGSGCISCSRITVNVVTGELEVASDGINLPALSFPVQVGFSYRSEDSYSGMLGYARSGLGEPGQHLIDLSGGDAYGVVILHEEQGDNPVYKGIGDGVAWSRPFGPTSALTKAGTAWNEQRQTGFITYYDSYGFASTKRDLRGIAHYYEYDALGSSAKLQRIRDASGRMAYFTYSGSQATAFTDWALRSTYFAYDGNGCLTSVKSPGGCQTTFAYDASKRLNALTDGDGFTVYYDYDGSGNLAKETVLGIGTTYFNFDQGNGKTNVIDALSRPTYYQYASNVISSVTNALLGRRAWIGANVLTDELSRSSYYVYDAANNRIESVRVVPGAAPVRRGYNPTVLDRLASSTDGRGFSSYYRYDSYGTATSSSDRAGNTTYFVNDVLGRRTAQTNPRGWATYFAYDSSGNQTSETDPLGRTSLAYFDTADSRIAAVDRRGNATYFGYDADGRLTSTIDPLGGVQQIGYTSAGLPNIQIDQRGGNTYYSYNIFRKVTRTADPGNGVTVDGFDAVGNRTSRVDPLGRAMYYRYDALDRMTAIIDAGGNGTYFGYDAVGNQLRTTDALGALTYFLFDGLDRATDRFDALGGRTQYQYDLSGNRINVVDPRGFQTYYVYDVMDRTVLVRDPLGVGTYFSFDGNGNRTAVTDSRLRTTYFGIDANDRMSSMVDPLGGSTTFAYDQDGNRVAVVDPRSNQTYFTPDALSRIASVRDALGNLTQFTYDPAGNRTAVTDARNAASYFVYDALNRRTLAQDPLANQSYFVYDAVGNLIATRDARSASSYFGYDVLNRLASDHDAVGGDAYFAYDSVGNLTSRRDRRGNWSYFAYDLLRRRTSRRDALGNFVYFTYDSVSNHSAQFDELGNKTYFSYDALGRRTNAVDPTGAQTAASYDPAGDWLTVRPPVGGSQYFVYDALRRLSCATDGLSNATYFWYDAAGNRLRTVMPRGFAQYFAYDAVNRVSSAGDASGSYRYFTYDAVGNATCVSDVMRRNTYFAYDLMGRVISRTDPVGAIVAFTYDANGNRTVETDALGHSTYYIYDSLNRVSRMDDPLGKSAYYQYDADSNLANQVDQNQALTYFTYDPVGRMTAILNAPVSGYGLPAYGYFAYGGSDGQLFGYDAKGNLVSLTDISGTTTKAYNSRSLLTRWTNPRGDSFYYAYDGARNRTSLQYPRGGAAAYFSYDAAQRLTQAIAPSGKAAYFQYDADSNPTFRRFGNGIMCYYRYDNADRVIDIRHIKVDGSAIAYFEYARDAMGKIATIVRESDLAIYYSYDAADRLTGEVWKTKSAGVQIYGFWYDYDSAGNRMRLRREYSAGVTWDTAYYLYDVANVLTKRWVVPADSTAYYTYDANGSLVKIIEGPAATYFEYAANGLVTRIAPPVAQGSPWQFYYDGQLSRYAIDKGGTISYYSWMGLNQMEERDASGNLVARYTHGYGRPDGVGSVVECQRVQGGSTYFQYLHMDHQGSVVAVTDASQAKQLQYTNDAFAREIAPPSGAGTNIPNDLQMFTNWQTITVGTQRYGLTPSRLWNPDLGIWLQRDPVPTLVKLVSSSRGNVMGIYDRTVLNFLETAPFPVPHQVGYSQYSSSAVPNGTDANGFWGEAGHFYTTYIVAIAAGLTPAQAFQLAYYSQLPDETITFDAIGGLFANFWTGNYFVQNYLHSLHGGDPEKRRRILRCLLKSKNLADWEKGLLIHALGDAYAHTYTEDTYAPSNGGKVTSTLALQQNGGKGRIRTGSRERAYGWPFGHLFTGYGGHEPDLISVHNDAYRSYVQDLYNTLGGGAANQAVIDSLIQQSGTWNENNELANIQNFRGPNGESLGYNFTAFAGVYDPVPDRSTVPGMSLSRGDVSSLIDKIRKAVADDCCE